MNKPGLIRRLMAAFTRPSTRWGAGVIAVAGFAMGMVFWIGFQGFVASTSTEEFCLGCHEMRAFPYAEYEQSAHFGSRSGVRPICADCHVPHGFVPKMQAKIRATFTEVPAHFMGKIDTPEQFEARREALAERVWARMRADDSKPCRNCHDVTAMSADEQTLRAVREHETGFAQGETCIDCHQGIAHKLPASMLEKEAEDVDFDFDSGSK